MTLVQKEPKKIYIWGEGEKTVDVTLLTNQVGRNSTATLFTADTQGLCTFTAYLYSVTTGQHAYARIYKNGTQIYEFDNNMHSGDSLVSTTFNVDVGDVISAESYCMSYDNNLHNISIQQQVEGVIEKDVKRVYLGDTQVRPVTFVDFLLVGGGGGGGAGDYGNFNIGNNCCIGGGGGGAGGVIYCNNYNICKGSYSITIGNGGSGRTGRASGCSGGDSTFSTFTAIGGGGGGGGRERPSSGGSGGGRAGDGNGYNFSPGRGTNGQGNMGGYGCYVSGGGGGGYSQIGQAPTDSCSKGGYGGCGLNSSISGQSYWYSSGGGGGGRNDVENGICGGGKGGSSTNLYGGNATTYGSGGGGALRTCAGGSGCQGIFILRYPTSCGYNITGGTKYTCGNYTIHCFTSNGTLTVN